PATLCERAREHRHIRTIPTRRSSDLFTKMPSPPDGQLTRSITLNTQANEWDPGLYDDKHSFVWKHGASVVELLAPQPGERILDLGCGTGQLTAKIAVSGAKVVGIDRSPAMIDQARKQFEHIDFQEADAHDFHFEQP